MKLALSLEDGVSVLSGSGEMTSHDVAILRAGLTKLLRSGRNRIVLDLPEVGAFPPDLFAEISKLDHLARELSGRIGVACKKELSQTSVLQCFETKALALESFRSKPVAAAKPVSTPVAAPVPPAPVESGEPQADPEKIYKEELRQKELGEMGELRKRAERLDQENQALLRQLHAAWLGNVKTTPADTAGTSDAHGAHDAHGAEVDVLRQKIGELLGQIKTLQGSAK